MAKLQWDAPGERAYETGVSKGVLYPMSAVAGVYEKGVAWNGLTAVTESPTGAEPSAIYADNIKYLTLMSIEELELTIEAYTYPEEWGACDGSAELEAGVSIGQQPRKKFGLTYQTVIGNDLNPEAGFKIHLVYGALAGPSERAYATINESPEAMTFSYSITTTPIEVAGHKPTALLTIDSTKVDAIKLKKITDTLYGTETEEPKLLTPDEITTILAAG